MAAVADEKQKMVLYLKNYVDVLNYRHDPLRLIKMYAPHTCISHQGELHGCRLK